MKRLSHKQSRKNSAKRRRRVTARHALAGNNTVLTPPTPGDSVPA